MEKYITKNGIKYELHGEQYYPMLEISEQTNYEIGKYGHLHLDFIKKHRRGTYTTLLTEGRLNEYLHNIDEADAALHAAINALSNELNATNEKVAALETFIIIVCVISGVAFCGCGTLAVFYIIDKRKKI